MAKKEIFEFGGTAYLSGAKALVVMTDTVGITNDSKQSRSVTPVGAKDAIKFVSWGENNDLPQQVMSKAYKNITVASNIDFNAKIAYGDKIIVCRKIRKDDGKIDYQELLESEEPDIYKFIEDNNINRIHQEFGNDMTVFYDSFVEFILNREKKPKIVMMRQKEVAFSRLSEQDEKTKRIEWHGYSAKWNDGNPDDVVVTKFLDRDAPIYDLKKLLGVYPDETRKTKDSGIRRFTMSLALPTPGRFYYSKPYWWSIFESGWYDCAVKGNY